MTPILRLACLTILVPALSGIAGCGDANETTKRPDRDNKIHFVEVAEVLRADLHFAPVHTGSLRPRRIVRIFNQEEGRIAELPLFESDPVAKGDLLVKLDDSLVRAEHEKAVYLRQQAELDLQRLLRIKSKQLVSEEELTHARTAVNVSSAEERMLATRLGYLNITAPFAGIVSARLREPGDAVPKHTHLLTVFDPNTLMTEVTVSELVLPYIKLGDPVNIRIDALGDASFEGQIARIHPAVDENSRRGRIEVRLDPIPPGARAGQLCRVQLDIPARQRLVVPFAAVRRDSEGEFVWLRDADHKARRQAVRTGIQLARQVEILDGLSVGDMVIVRGFLGLRAGQAVQQVSNTTNQADGA